VLLRRRPVAALAALALAAGAVAAAVPSSAGNGHGRGPKHRGQAEPTVVSPLSHSGRWLTDNQGRVVVLHGFNMVAKLPPYDVQQAGFGADDAAFLQQHGFTTIRLGVIWKRLEPSPGIFDDGYLKSVAATVATLADHGIYSLLDFHQDMWNEKFQGEGAPDWAVVDDGLPADPPAGFPGNYFAMPALWRAFDHFWNNDATKSGVRLQDAYAAAWRHVATYFRGDDAVLGYDLLNEPFPGSQWYSCLSPAGCPVFDKQYLAPFVTKMLKAVRSADREHLVFYEPQLSFDFSAGTSIGDPGDALTGFAFHAYCAAAVGAPETPPTRAACDQVEDRTLSNADQQSSTSGDALLLTEWGATDDPQELSSVAADADRHMDSWQEWTYVGGDPSAAKPTEGIIRDLHKPPTGTNVKWDKLAILERPYPQVVAGTPTSWSFDTAARTFSLSYSTHGVSGALRSSLTVVYIPTTGLLGHSYHVIVGGAHVVSAPGASRLVLRTLPGASSVKVTVLP
jgi:endoglycosylceramidase